MKAGETEGIETVVKAINTHISNANVCQMGCAALVNMLNNGKTLIKQTKQIVNEMNR